MNTRIGSICAILSLVLATASSLHANTVTVANHQSQLILSNGTLTAAIDKNAGTFTLDYRGTRVVEHGYWSLTSTAFTGESGFGSAKSTTIKANGGDRGEVVCSFPYEGKGLPCDVVAHYAVLDREDALFAWTTWTHKPSYPAVSIGLARAACKLPGSVFDYLAIDDRRHGLMPSGQDWDNGEQLNMKEVRRIVTGPFAGKVEHKYDYSACFADTPAYGWISTRRNIGLFLINPSIEYISGGPTKSELTAHLDVNRGGAPTLLNVFIGPHYGGSSLSIAAGETWSKTFGPFILYCNDGASSDAIFKQAVEQGNAERRKWPYDWAAGEDYPASSERAMVKGYITVTDPMAPKLNVQNMQVGLASAPYTAGDEDVTWQRDAKHYQFWTHAGSTGAFEIRNVRPGSYVLYAFADGVLGEFSKANVSIMAGKPIDLGKLTWTPQRFGRQLWDIGIPNRSAGEFRHGDDYWHWGLYNLYPQEFPNDVNFVIGKSDFRSDWNYCQPPRVVDGQAKSTTWSIRFDLPAAVHGAATLRLAICGYRGRSGISIDVNDHDIGGTGPIPEDGVMHRDGIRGVLYERDIPFDAALLRAGTNVIKLTPRAKAWPDGVLYDYLRLELNENAAPPPPQQAAKTRQERATESEHPSADE
jgi:rhamnogalacturonan endolyase